MCGLGAVCAWDIVARNVRATCYSHYARRGYRMTHWKAWKRSTRITVVTIAIVLALTFGAIAAWQATRTASTTAMIWGTFEIAQVVCVDADLDTVGNECYADLVNVHNMPMTVIWGLLSADNPGIPDSGEYRFDDTPPGDFNPAQVVQSGETARMYMYFTVSGAAEPGETTFTLSATATGG